MITTPKTDLLFEMSITIGIGRMHRELAPYVSKWPLRTPDRSARDSMRHQGLWSCSPRELRSRETVTLYVIARPTAFR